MQDQQTKSIRINGNCFIYPDPRTRKKNYQCRVTTFDGRIITRSTKTNDPVKAEIRAIKIYDDICTRIRQDIPLKDPTIAECRDKWLTWSADKRTKRHLNATRTLFTRIIEPWAKEVVGSRLGLDTKVTQIRRTHLEQFPNWRELHQAELGKKPMAKSSLENEIGSFNAVMNLCAEMKFVDQPYNFPRLSRATYTKGTKTNKKARPSHNTFTEDQISALDSYFKRHVLPPTSEWNRGCVGFKSDGTVKKNNDGSTSSKGSQGSVYLSRVNLYASYFILKNTGMRLQELYDLKWKDIQATELKDRSRASEHNPKGLVYVMKLKETKGLRVKSTGRGYRMIVAPYWLKESCFDRIKAENPQWCSSNDYVINSQGRRKKTQQVLFEKVQQRPSSWRGRPVDCSVHRDGTNLDLRHLRSYYVSRMLLDKQVSPIVLCQQTGHKIETIMQYYIQPDPSEFAKALFGGHTVSLHQQLVDNVMSLRPPS